MILDSLACVISATGIFRPNYADIYETLQFKFQSIYGSDSYIDPDSQDGQLLAVFAKAIDDCNAQTVAAYNSYSPATAQGSALSNDVKINGIRRLASSNGSVDLTITGVIGTVILNGIAADVNGVQWLLPPSVTIPGAGFIIVTATCAQPGAVAAPVGTVTSIATPTRGWQAVTNATAAAPGAPVESDAELRQRQTTSTALPSQTVLAGTLGAVENVAGVEQAAIYENDTDAPDINGLPEHSIAVVVLGGDNLDIAEAIAVKKTEGCYTYGTTSVPYTDPQGITYTIRFFRPTPIPVSVIISITALAGYNTVIGDALVQGVADFINALRIGKSVDIAKLYLPAQFYGAAESDTYEIDDLLAAIIPGVPATADLPIAFNERATCLVADITLNVT